MNRLLIELRSRYAELDIREQRAVLALSAFLLVVLFYLLVWAPVVSFQADSQTDYDRHLDLLTYLKSTESDARAAASGGAVSRQSGQAMLSAVSAAARLTGINPSRLQPEGNDGVSVWFDSVSFTLLMRWLEKLETERGIVVRQIAIDSRDQPGLVSARLVLR